MYAIQVSSQTTTEPVSVDEIKTHLRLLTTAQGGTTAEDALIDSLITAARKVAENKTKRALVDTQYRMTIDGFWSSVIELPYGVPLSNESSDVSIAYRKTTGDSTTLSTEVYAVEPDNEPGLVRLAYGQTWPSDVQDAAGSVEITYRSGYTTATIPAPIKTWIKMRVGQMYEFREPIITGAAQSELRRDFVDGLLDGYTLIEV